MSVELEGVVKRFGEIVAVDGIDLTIPSGEFFSVIGASGCGKTTTLRMIAGFEDPDAGVVRVDGKDVTGLRPYRRPVNTVFQNYALFPHLDVFENVAFGLREARRPKDEVRLRVREMIELVQLAGREHAKPRQLSGGQQQRVALARALVNRPRVLLLDEPLGALDLKLRREMQLQLKDIQQEVGVTFVYVTHDQEEAFAMSNAVAVMNGGRIDQIGRPEEVYRRPATEFVAEFVGTTNRFVGRIAEASAGGTYLVELEGRDTFRCSGPPASVSKGTSAVVIVRPENIEVSRTAGNRDGGLVGTVSDASFMGAHRTLTIDVSNGPSVIATVSGAADTIQPGDTVDIHWSAGAAWIVGIGSAVGEELISVE
jgi:spermidine/putrescine transport system ATP-binding protein